MKKKYIQPATNVHFVKLHSMLAGSPLGEGGGDSITGTIDPTVNGGGDDALGKDDLDFGW